MIFSSSLPEIKSLFRRLRGRSASHRYLLLMMAGFLDHPSRMSAGQAAAAIASLGVHRAGVGRHLTSRKCRLRSIRSQVSERVLQSAHAAGAYTLLLDMTLVSQQGVKTENTFSTGNRQRRPAKGRRYQKRKNPPRTCHAFVFGLLLTPSGVRVPYVRSYYTQQYAQQLGLRHRTQAELGAEIIREIALPAGATLRVVGDTAFEASCIRDACRERAATWIAPCNPERMLDGPAPRAKVSSLIGSLRADQLVPVALSCDDAAQSSQRRASACRRGRKKKPKTFYVHTERRCVKSMGEVQIVFSCTQPIENGQVIQRDDVKILLTNDLSLPRREIVAWYAVRWQIELFFKELKSGLGMHRYRFRSFARVEAWIDACLITFQYLEWIRLRRLASTSLADRARQWWTWQRTWGIAAAVRQQVAQAELRTIHKSTRTKYGLHKLRHTLLRAIPTEQRLAL
jgi:hypothetical protein